MQHVYRQLSELAEKSIEGMLSAEEVRELESLCSSNENLRFYTDYLALNAHLRLNCGLSSPAALPILDLNTAGATTRLADNRGHGSLDTVRGTVKFALLALALSLCALLGYSWLLRNGTAPVAQLIEAKECRWHAGTLPTEVGAQLGSGRLRLAEGLAAIRFTSGVEVKLEGPADIEIISPMKCVLHGGRLIANVPDTGKGFVVETPSSILTDYGTEFGVTVQESNQVDMVTVFRGRVDAVHRTTGRTEQMNTGASFRFTAVDIQAVDSNQDAFSPPVDTSAQAIEFDDDSTIQITTAQGRGKDVFIQRKDIPADRMSETLLLVKRPAASWDDWERRAYIGLDLSAMTNRRASKAELSLTFAPTGFGYAYLVPDATFTVYGVCNDELDDWEERKMNWQNAPAIWDVSSTASDQVVELGSFTVPQGVQSATCTVSNAALRDFVNNDRNRFASLIVVRQTAGLGPSDLVHGIASRRHPTLSPPTLRLSMESQ